MTISDAVEAVVAISADVEEVVAVIAAGVGVVVAAAVLLKF